LLQSFLSVWREKLILMPAKLSDGGDVRTPQCLVIVFLLLFAVSRSSDAFGADGRTHLAQGTQTVTGCMVGCGTQVGSCQGTCLAISSGVATTSVTIVAQRRTRPSAT
jgi:hypothetical protein